MTDITTTEVTEVAEIVLTDNRRVAVGEIARAEEAASAAQARVVELDVTISLRVYLTRTARTAEDAATSAEEALDTEEVIDALRARGWDEITFDSTEAERS